MDDTTDPEDKRNDGNSAANNANYIVGKSEIKYCASQRWGSDWQRHLEQAACPEFCVKQAFFIALRNGFISRVAFGDLSCRETARLCNQPLNHHGDK